MSVKIEEKGIKSFGKQIILRIFSNESDPKFDRIIVFASAMGTKQVFYSKLSSYLAENGYSVITFDYQGIGLSKEGSLRGQKITIEEWTQNTEDVIDFAESLKSNEHAKLFYLCHSLGGQIFGLITNSNKITAAAMYTSQNGYWRYYFNKTFYIFFWYMMVPPLVFLFGYFPFKLLRGGEDLPKQIMKSWKKWCTSKDYFFDDPSVLATKNFSLFTGPIRTHSFTDDGWATKPAVESMVSHFTNAKVEHLHISPSEYGLKSINHFGFFREKSKALWEELVKWFNDQ